MTRIGVVVALAREAKTLLAEIEQQPHSSSAPATVSIRTSGVGAENATKAATQLVNDGVTGLLSWGVAGALVPGLKTGQLLLPRHIIDDEGAQRATDTAWHRRAVAALSHRARPVTAPVAQSRAVLADTAAKTELGRSTGACAADMESFAVGTVAEASGVRFLTVRCIVDNLEMNIPSAVGRAVRPDGHDNLFALVGPCLRNPWLLIDLIRLGLAFNTAAQSLRQAAKGLGRDQLGFDSHAQQ